METQLDGDKQWYVLYAERPDDAVDRVNAALGDEEDAVIERDRAVVFVFTARGWDDLRTQLAPDIVVGIADNRNRKEQAEKGKDKHVQI